jgi:hypothetical protein
MTIASYELYRSARVGVGADGSGRAYALYHDEVRFEPKVFLFEFCAFQMQGCTAVGDPNAADPTDADNRVARAGLRIRRLIVQMECRAQMEPRTCGPADPAGGLTLSRARIGLADASPPALDAPSGPLVTPGAVLEGVQAVSASARDAGGGVERFEVIVDGVVAGAEAMKSRHPACRTPYVDLVPCPRAASASFVFDTTRLPNGPHDVQIAAVDAAGNRTLAPPVPVRVANGATPNGAGASRAARLVAGFARRPRDRARVDFGSTRPIRGRLTDAQGSPIAGARLDVMATQRRPGARPEQEGVVTTRADGRFRYRPHRGPSRRLEFAYRAFSLDPEPTAVAGATLNVRSGVRLVVRPRRTTSRGTIRFRGRLLGGPGRDGVQVTLYAVGRKARSRVPVAVLETDASGRFRFRYQFLRTFAPFTYRFVARVERQRGYPYAPGSSPIATVRVVR